MEDLRMYKYLADLLIFDNYCDGQFYVAFSDKTERHFILNFSLNAFFD